MTDEQAQDAVKALLYIDTSNTDFDSEIDQFVDESTSELWPILQMDVAPNTDTSLASGENSFALPSGIDNVKWLEVSDTQVDYLKIPAYLYKQHAGSIYLQETYDETKTIRIFGTTKYAHTDLPDEFHNVVVYWAVAKFYRMLIGNKRKYNIYTTATGRAGVDNMASMAEDFQDDGNTLLMDRVALLGQS